MSKLIKLSIDLDHIGFLKIGGPVYVTFPTIGPLSEVSVPFDDIDINRLNEVYDLRQVHSDKASEIEREAIKDWQEARRITKRMAQDQLDLETEENDGKTQTAN